MSRRIRRIGIAVLVLTALFATLVPGVRGQESGDTTTTTTKPLPSPKPTTPPPPTTQAPQPEPTTPGPPTTQAPLPPEEQPPPEDAPLSEVEQNLLRLQEERRAQLASLQTQADALAKDIADVRATVGELDVSIEDLNDRIASVLRRLAAARKILRHRALAAYKGDPSSYLSVLIDARSPSEFLNRIHLLSQANAGDRGSVTSLKEERDALATQQKELADIRRDHREKIVALETTQQELGRKLQEMLGVLSSLPQQQTIAVNGFVFPTMAPFTYSDDFGACRGAGCHRAHQGNDIFCVWGSPLRASERGRIVDVRNRGLGGLSFWLEGESGTHYYYAHMSAYYPGVGEGTLVEPGQFVGFCGNTGNAASTPPHLHYQVHPEGRENYHINPYPILKATELAMEAAASLADSDLVTIPAPLAPPAQVDENGKPIAPPAGADEQTHPEHPALTAADPSLLEKKYNDAQQPIEVKRAPPKRRGF